MQVWLSLAAVCLCLLTYFLVLLLCLRLSVIAHLVQARDLETVQEMAKVNPGRKQADMNGEVVAKLHLVEKHIRKNKLQVRQAVHRCHLLSI